jgi:hypothetical protein
VAGLGDPAGSNATAGLAVGVAGTHKPLHHNKVQIPSEWVHHILIDKRNASNLMDMKSRSGANSYSVNFLVQGKYRCKITYRTRDISSCPKQIYVERLRENRIIIFYQQQLG